MEKYTFFNGVEIEEGVYDREYDAEDFASYFASFIGNGVYDNGLKVEADPEGTRKVIVQEGEAFINGYYYKNTAPLSFNVSMPSSEERDDIVVLRLDLENREIKLHYVEGTTEPTRNSTIYEIVLAEVYTSQAESIIRQEHIRDTRQDNTVCGIVVGTVKQIDTTNLFNQFTDAFMDWFDEIKGQLTEDQATHLYNLIMQRAYRTTTDTVNVDSSTWNTPITLSLMNEVSDYTKIELLITLEPTAISGTNAYMQLFFGDNEDKFYQVQFPKNTMNGVADKVIIDVIDDDKVVINGTTIVDLNEATTIKAKFTNHGCNPKVSVYKTVSEV